MGWKLLLVLMVAAPDTGGSVRRDEAPAAGLTGAAPPAAASPDPGANPATGLRASGCRFAGSSCEAGSRTRQSLAPGSGGIGDPAQIISRPPVGTGSLILGGGIGWGAGLAAGFGAGYLVEPDAGEGWFGAGEWWLGAALGSSIGTCVGVHVADRGQGSLVLTCLAAAVALPVGMVAAVPLMELSGIGLLAIPAAQIGAAVLAERLTRRQRGPPDP